MSEKLICSMCVYYDVESKTSKATGYSYCCIKRKSVQRDGTRPVCKNNKIIK